jgi:uncharacterized membrane protein/YHS domain-containing protein
LFLVHFIQAFLPAALATGAIVGLWWPKDGRTIIRAACWISIAGIFSGAIVQFAALKGSSTLEAQIWLKLASVGTALWACLAAVVGLGSKRFPALRLAGGLSFVAAINALASFIFFGAVTDEALSVSSVLNTDLILNVSALALGIFVILGTAALVARMTVKSGPAVTVAFLLLVCGINCFGWIAEIMLAALRLEMIEMTTERLSFVAKTTGFSYLFMYAQIALAVVLAIIFFAKRPRLNPDELSRVSSPERRKATARAIAEQRAFKAAVACVLVMLSTLAYHDLYASRPPTLSEAKPVTPDADGEIKLKIEDVQDGRLHRFSYITSDGTKVRFFLINRYKTGVKIGVVYDACMICGDMGYIQSGNDVICIACNVRMNLPSIGKPGGCNPIPFEHEVRDDTIVIKASELDRGANYFHEKVSIEVKDPVTGTTLINLKAPFRYDFGGRTYFFESEQSLRKFQDNPEDYVKAKPRRFRSQGWQSGSGNRPQLHREEHWLFCARLGS